MAIKINNNIFSMLVRRNLDRNDKALTESYERLSSGERLNRAADDPSAMAASEQLRHEISGLRQNQLNVNGAFSLIGTTESNLNSMADMLQRVRELTVQAASETLGAQSRSSIQTEIDEIYSEFDRIASSSKYNELNLLDGSLQNRAIQVGTASADTIALSVDDFRLNVVGQYARTASTSVSDTPVIANSVSIRGVPVPASQPDGISTVNADASAKAKAYAINSIESQTGVRADIVPASLTAVAAVQPLTIDGSTNRLVINGVNIAPVTVQAGDSNGNLINTINSCTNQTGVRASLDSGGILVLTADDGRNIDIQTQGSIADELGLQAANGDANRQVAGGVELSAYQDFNIQDPGNLLGLGSAPLNVTLDATTALGTQQVDTAENAQSLLSSIDAAINQINNSRSSLGAIHNRLEDLTDSLARRVEDLSSADSKIRDTDFAYETTRLTQSQILQDAAIAMLTQANLTPQKALELLR